ncbi:MAG: TonB-dependent receptor plug domain-containing protein [Muribaculaceae bacterium]|nr:TonB-dependent receptor plug domain-containing protein [Muribaculaceae bacterium]
MKKNFFLLGMMMSAPLVYAGGMGESEFDGSNSSSVSETADTAVTLQEVAVRANFSNEQKTPLNLTTLSPQDIRIHATAPNYVEVMQGVPGVYATASTGNYGDASLNIRGFKQDNIAIMLNGIPIQGLTSGSMYWSNWMGLSDATYAIQIQKGMGSSMLADCAMGGLVNIITKTSSDTPAGEVAMSVTEHGLLKTVLNYSTGRLANGWSANAMLSYTNGNGFVECSHVSTLSYMLSVNKRFGANHLLSFNAIGSPETHDQRNTELTNAEVEQYGVGYSKNWGYLGGKKYSIARTLYYKPYFTLQHIMHGESFSMKN